jgi:hypothetical protein
MVIFNIRPALHLCVLDNTVIKTAKTKFIIGFNLMNCITRILSLEVSSETK